MSEQQDKTTDQGHAPRFDIAKWVIAFSFTVIGVLGLASIVAVIKGDAAKVAQVKDILSILLPVIGAWAGTVIAFYFSRDNFETAAKSTKELVKQMTPEEKLAAVKIRDAMIPMDKAIKLTLDKPTNAYQVQKDLVAGLMEANGVNRLPMLGKQGEAKYIWHRSILDQFMVAAGLQGKALDDLTLEDLLADAKYKAIGEAICVLPEDSTLAEAKRTLDHNRNCSDIFITQSGKRDEAVIGWLTNGTILAQLHAS